MKIAQIAPLIERVPPQRYGGTERVVSALTEALVARGHEVTLFASGDSATSAKLASIYPKGLREAKLLRSAADDWTLRHIRFAYAQETRFDIIHDHVAPASVAVADRATTPVIMTMHGEFTPDNRELFMALSHPRVVCLSHAHRASFPGAHLLDIVYNGLSMEKYPFGERPGEYLLQVGRIAPEKGTHIAIDVAEQLHLPLIIAAKVDAVDKAYFQAEIRHRLSERIRWVGEVDEKERNDLMRRALCFLHPMTGVESFGLTLIEAMACGCPVVAFNRGSIPEIIKDGVTGYVVKDAEAMKRAVLSIVSINRAACREHALSKFNVKRMTDDYEALYAKVRAGRA
ncbi:MAG: Glycosyl transferase, group 1 [Parcubacteria group bacterium Greene0416_79]|nr:MAG: Glycosyl transferase, group 1 [Parcubacteria group bacterium Greene0416_79]